MSRMSLVAAASLFWLAWLLMPGVGVTDPAQIFDLVTSQRTLVVWSVVAQLLSAVLYVPAMLDIATHARLRRLRAVRWGASLLIVGAMGSAADAVLHLLAYAMTDMTVDRATMIPVMAFMQGPGLALLAPLILSFFVGGAVLSTALGGAGLVSRWSARFHILAVIVAVAGGALAANGVVPGRVVGLLTLGLVSMAQVWIGIAASGIQRESSVAVVIDAVTAASTSMSPGTVHRSSRSHTRATVP